MTLALIIIAIALGFFVGYMVGLFYAEEPFERDYDDYTTPDDYEVFR